MVFSQTEQNFTVKFDSGSGGSQDGFSPIVDVTAIDGGHRVTITDKQGAESFDVMDGETPEKGVDYWTEEDKAEIAEQTQAQIEEATEEISEQVNQNKTDISSLNEKVEDFITNGYVTPQMFGAIGDGVADDTDAIQSALNASSFVYIPDGVYMINATFEGYDSIGNGGIKPKSGQTIILSLNATLKAITNSTSFYNIINLFDVKDVSIFGGKIEGDREYHVGTTGEHGHGIAIRACNNITIDGIEVFNCWGDSVDVGYYGETNSSNIRVYNCNLHDSRRQGISITGVSGMVVRDCKIYNINGTAPQYGIDIEPDGTVGIAENIVIDSCEVVGNIGGAIVIADRAENKIETIRITNCVTDGKFLCYTCNNLTLDANRIEQLYLGTKNTIISNCDIGVLLPDACSGTFSNCYFKSETASGLIVGYVGRYPEKNTDYLFFDNCTFVTSKEGQYLFNGKHPNDGYVDNQLPEKIFKFTNCNILMTSQNSNLLNRVPEEIVFDGCNITFASAPDGVFLLKNVQKGTKLRIHNTTVFSATRMYNIVGVDDNTGYEIEIYNSKFSESKHFMTCSSNGTSGGIVRSVNNIMNVAMEFVLNNNTFELKIANEPITKMSELQNDSGFLTSFTETDPTVPEWAKSETKPNYTKTEVGLGNVDNERQYSVSNPPPYPVSSVNGQTGKVNISIPTKTSLLENDSGFLTEEILNEKNYANKSGAETWTFTLDDGTTITKKVVLV